MTIQTMTFGLGAVLLIVGILGSGFEIKEIKIPKVSAGVRITASVVGLMFVGIAVFQSYEQPNVGGSEPKMEDMEWDTNRLGPDYFSFVLPTDNPSSCMEACQVDPLCQAWTFVKPNTIRGPEPICSFKGAIPPPQHDICCVSGTKGE